MDYSGIVTNVAEKYQSLIICRFVWIEGTEDEDHFQVQPTHFVLPQTTTKKDVDLSAECFTIYFENLRHNEPNLKKISIFSDGGAGDFKNSKFERFLMSFQEEYDIVIEHTILAPYHGWGACDSAHSQTFRKLKTWMLADKSRTIPNGQPIVD